MENNKNNSNVYVRRQKPPTTATQHKPYDLITNDLVCVSIFIILSNLIFLSLYLSFFLLAFSHYSLLSLKLNLLPL